MTASGGSAASRSAAAQEGLGFADHRRLGRHVGEPSAAVAGRADHEVAEVGAEAVRAAKEFAVVQNAQPEAALDVDDQKVVEVARLSEPVLGERRRD